MQAGWPWQRVLVVSAYPSARYVVPTAHLHLRYEYILPCYKYVRGQRTLQEDFRVGLV